MDWSKKSACAAGITTGLFLPVKPSKLPSWNSLCWSVFTCIHPNVVSTVVSGGGGGVIVGGIWKLGGTVRTINRLLVYVEVIWIVSKFLLVQMGVLAPLLRSAHALVLQLTIAEICLLSLLQTSPSTSKKTYAKFRNPNATLKNLTSCAQK